MKLLLKNTSLEFLTSKFEPKRYDKTSFIAGSFVRTSGVESSNPDFATTDFISIVGAKKITASCIFGTTNIAGIAFYDNNKTFVSAVYNVEGADATNDSEYTLPSIPENAVYIRGVARKTSTTAYIYLE